jgi:SAM-dependent methyltransferase
VEQYIDGGRSSAVWVKGLLDSLPLPKPLTLLDFASGFGRISRHLPSLLTDAEIFTCDIHPAAFSFNQSIGLGAVQSSTIPELFNPGRKFDAIIAISFFTHMPSHTWGRWLRSIAKWLTPNGMLIFTTHGRVAIARMGITHTQVDRNGFRFDTRSEQKDLDPAEYGSTVTFFEYVHRQIENANLHLVSFREGGAGYQDLIIVTPG